MADKPKYTLFVGAGMKDKCWKVTADHPVLARPDKYGLDKSEATEYANELERLGYENITKTSL